jgi:hypothetical protein
LSLPPSRATRATRCPRGPWGCPEHHVRGNATPDRPAGSSSRRRRSRGIARRPGRSGAFHQRDGQAAGGAIASRRTGDGRGGRGGGATVWAAARCGGRGDVAAAAQSVWRWVISGIPQDGRVLPRGEAGPDRFTELRAPQAGPGPRWGALFSPARAAAAARDPPRPGCRPAPRVRSRQFQRWRRLHPPASRATSRPSAAFPQPLICGSADRRLAGGGSRFQKINRSLKLGGRAGRAAGFSLVHGGGYRGRVAAGALQQQRRPPTLGRAWWANGVILAGQAPGKAAPRPAGGHCVLAAGASRAWARQGGHVRRHGQRRRVPEFIGASRTGIPGCARSPRPAAARPAQGARPGRRFSWALP